MGTLNESPVWEVGVRHFEANAVLTGGPDCPDNLPLSDLANRTAWLKQQVESAQNGLAGHEAAADPHPQYLTSAEGDAKINAHLAAADPHPQYATDTDLTNHTGAADPHPAYWNNIRGDAKIAAAIAALVNSSPSTLDTLAELATALGNDPNFATTITNSLATKATQAGVQGQTYTAFTTTGATGAFVLAPTPAVAAYAAGQRFRVKFHAAGNGADVINISALGNKSLKQYDSAGAKIAAVIATNQLADIEYDGVDMLILDPLPPSAGVTSVNGSTGAVLVHEVPVRQTVLGGPVDTGGLPTFLPATSVSLSVTSQNIAAGAPFVVAAANGFNSAGALERIGISTANLTWGGLTANATNYLYVDVAANGTLTPGSTTAAPIYQQGGTPAVAAKQATFNISQMKMFVGNGATAPQTYRVFVGEAVTGASTVTSTVAYAYMGQNIIQSATLASTTVFSYNHQIGAGIIPRVEYAIKCVTANNGWAVGDEVNRWIDGMTSVSDTPLAIGIDAQTVRGIVANTSGIVMSSKASAAIVNSAVTNWKFIFRVNRGW